MGVLSSTIEVQSSTLKAYLTQVIANQKMSALHNQVGRKKNHAEKLITNLKRSITVRV